MPALKTTDLGIAIRVLTQAAERHEQLHKLSCDEAEHCFVGRSTGKRGRIYLDKGKCAYEGDLFSSIDVEAAWAAHIQQLADETVGREAATTPEESTHA
jgi:hypothetical protein